jgi:hypothetical protein
VPENRLAVCPKISRGRICGVIDLLCCFFGRFELRGSFQDQGGMFSYIAPESRGAANHPLRAIRELVRDILKEMSRSFAWLYAKEGRPSVSRSHS